MFLSILNNQIALLLRNVRWMVLSNLELLTSDSVNGVVSTHTAERNKTLSPVSFHERPKSLVFCDRVQALLNSRVIRLLLRHALKTEEGCLRSCREEVEQGDLSSLFRVTSRTPKRLF